MPLTASESTTKIPFCGSPRPTLGVELEVQILDPATMNLTSGSLAILDRVNVNGVEHPKIKQELTQSTVEVITGICETVDEARADLAATLEEVYAIGDEVGLAFALAGTHPFGQWRDQEIFPNERYEMLVERIQWPARRLLIYGLHVHVGVSSGEKAIAITNALTTYIPHLLALSASSPFTDHEDTGLASARSKIFEGMPTAGLPYRLANYGEFQSFMNTLIRAGAIQSVREIWWDIRPHPNFGTIEVRVCDVPSTLTEVAALSALIQSLVACLSEHYDEGHYMTILRPWIVRENKWRAARSGLGAEIITDNEGGRAPLRQEIEALVENLGSFAQKLGCYDELQDVRTILRDGASYERQRRAYAETGSLEAIVRALATEMRADVMKGATP
ncbi:MAG: glutamate--cysteine ligase [Rhodothermales bacterium]